MTPQRARLIENLYAEALERNGSERTAFLEKACGGDRELLTEIQSLLDQGTNTGSFISRPGIENLLISGLLMGSPLMQCPSCSVQVPAESRFCSSCGQAFSSPSQIPTVAPDQPAQATPAQHKGTRISSSSVPVGGFAPGVILANRYRIIGLLGRGGMGEVYRADDLKLGQPVALKFLPRAFSKDPVRRERFFAEVRITRGLAHPNICRVYDIAEIDGQHFLSMEYIDGENLASLIQRIGYLSNEKALDLARQLAAGLSAAHERGVLHRDLKPANIMIDGHGRVRITDFGLAIAAGEDSQSAEMFGTPAYMAPEQFAGKGSTVRSDIYALGLIFYEIYSGKKAFKAN